METEKKNRLREFGVFLGLLMFPVLLVLLGCTNVIQAIKDYSDGLLVFFTPTWYGYDLVSAIIYSIVAIGLGVFLLWAAMPKYKEYLNKCGSK